MAPDAFKGSLTAAQAAGAIAQGLRAARPDAEVVRRPVADGGEGTVEVVVAAGWEHRVQEVTGPDGAVVRAGYALSPPSSEPVATAVVELAAASGLTLVPEGERAPRQATTVGTGELVRAALDSGARRLVLGIGGSATTDGGTGLARALGARFLDQAGHELPPGGAALADLDRIDLAGLDPRLAATEVVVACDVDNPLTGPNGAAAVYGPQKGAGPADVAALDRGLSRLAEVVRRDLGVDVEAVPGAGAAGGVGAGALAFLGARLTPGIDLLLDLVGFDACLPGTALVVTGEGRFDRQTLSGKAPAGVARRARAAGVPVVVLAGWVEVADEDRAHVVDLGVVACYALLDLEPDLRTAQRDAADLLRRLAADTLPQHLPDQASTHVDDLSATTSR